MNRRGSVPITEETVGKMKGKEEDEERNDNICRQRTDNQTDSSNTEATLIPCGSSGERANYTYIAIHSHDVSIVIITAIIL